MQINHPQTLAEVTRAFDRYQQAIIDNDIAVLNELFWNHELTIRYGTGENLYGHAEIASFRGARDPKSVARMVGKTVVTSYGLDAATTNIECLTSTNSNNFDLNARFHFKDGQHVTK